MTDRPESRRSFFDLSKPEARAIFDAYVEGVPDRAAAFIEEVRRLGGPADKLDYSVDSLVPFWTWFLATQRLPDEPVPEAVMRANDPPWWFDFWGPFGMRLGPDLARLVTQLAAYIATIVIRTVPDAKWVTETRRSYVDYNAPLLDYGGPAGWNVDSTLIIMTGRAFRREMGRDAPTGLRDFVQRTLDGAAQWQARQAEPPPPPYDVGPVDEPGTFTHEVDFEEEWSTKHARIERFVARLRAEPGIERAHREDREFILLGAPDLTDDAVTAAVARAWAASGRP